MIAADSSVLVPALLADHEFHDECHEAASLIDAAIGHALLETYAVLTRLPHPYTVPPAQAREAIASYGSHVLMLGGEHLEPTLGRLAAARVSGGATYDGWIAATAAANACTLLTRDERAAGVYERLGADVTWVAT